jgi:membrane protease YdiL (CAAX protease family)
MKRGRSWLALALLVPVPSLGAYCGTILFAGTPLGYAVYAASKAWLVGFPFVWTRFVEKTPVSFSPAREGGWGMGVASGLLIGAAMVGSYSMLRGFLIDPGLFAHKMSAMGLDSPLAYAGGAAFWITTNSLLEEYVWRWFCVRQCEKLFPPRAAIALSALCFTFHHIVALSAYMTAPAIAICAVSVFIGGIIWSSMYVRYRSIWPGYVSHALADLAMFSVGAWLLFRV